MHARDRAAQHVLAREAHEPKLEVGRIGRRFQHGGIADRADASARHRTDRENMRIDVDPFGLRRLAQIRERDRGPVSGPRRAALHGDENHRLAGVRAAGLRRPPLLVGLREGRAIGRAGRRDAEGAPAHAVIVHPQSEDDGEREQRPGDRNAEARSDLDRDRR